MWKEMLSRAQHAPAPAAVRAECPEKPAGGGLVTLPCSWVGKGRRVLSSLPGQVYRPRDHAFSGWDWRKWQEGALGLYGRKASLGPGAESEKASARRRHAGPALGELMVWGRDRGDVALM